MFNDSYYEGGVADGAMEVVGGDGGDVDDGGASPPVVIFVPDDVAFDVRGFIVTEIPHIFDSVVLTGVSFDNGLLGLQIKLHLFVVVLTSRFLLSHFLASGFLGLEHYQRFQILQVLLLQLKQDGYHS
jgi:hypothetical protein